MSFRSLPRWSLVCDGDGCERAWTGWTEADDEDRLSVVILLDAPQLVDEEREALTADGWLVCAADGSRVLCPDCRAAAAAALLGSISWRRTRRARRRARPASAGRSRPPRRG